MYMDVWARFHASCDDVELLWQQPIKMESFVMSRGGSQCRPICDGYLRTSFPPLVSQQFVDTDELHPKCTCDKWYKGVAHTESVDLLVRKIQDGRAS